MKLKELNHRHIVQCYTAFLISQPLLQVCTVLEYCSERDLTDYLGRMRSGEVPAHSQVIRFLTIRPAYHLSNYLSLHSVVIIILGKNYNDEASGRSSFIFA
jgi:hypothetical protein